MPYWWCRCSLVFGLSTRRHRRCARHCAHSPAPHRPFTSHYPPKSIESRGAEPEPPDPYGGTYKLNGTTNVLGISLGTWGNLPGACQTLP